MRFMREGDVRRWARAHTGGAILWVEAAPGGTSGFPDLVVVRRGRVVFVELKIAKAGRDGRLRFSLRPSQRRVLNQIRSNGGEAWVLVGEKGTDRLWIDDGGGLRLLGEDEWLGN